MRSLFLEFEESFLVHTEHTIISNILTSLFVISCYIKRAMQISKKNACEIQVTIRCGKTLRVLNIAPQQTVGVLKNDAAKLHGMTQFDRAICIHLRGKQLRDDETLDTAEISNNCEVLLGLCLRGGADSIPVKNRRSRPEQQPRAHAGTCLRPHAFRRRSSEVTQLR